MFLSSQASDASLLLNTTSKVVDFNTIDNKGKSSGVEGNQLQLQHHHEQEVKPSASFFSYLWPFSFSSRATTTTTTTTNASMNTSQSEKRPSGSVVDAISDKVIAMKKVNDAEEDEFIDIQVRELSYAEVAALDLQGKRQPKSSISKSNGVSKKQNSLSSDMTGSDFLVVDHDLDLEKEITDLEMMEALGDCRAASEDADESLASPEDRWDDFMKTKSSKKLQKKLQKKRRSRK